MTIVRLSLVSFQLRSKGRERTTAGVGAGRSASPFGTIARRVPCWDTAELLLGGLRLTANYLIGLGSLLPLNNIKLDLVAFFEALVPVELNCAVMNENVGSILTTDETITFRVVEPLDLPFICRHFLGPSLVGTEIKPDEDAYPACTRDALAGRLVISKWRVGGGRFEFMNFGAVQPGNSFGTGSRLYLLAVRVRE